MPGAKCPCPVQVQVPRAPRRCQERCTDSRLRIMRWRSVLLVMMASLAACGNPVSSTPTTGLTGVVVRGPITPVCQIGRPCDAPFSAGFSVEQNGRRVDRFRSDAEGRFTVWLPPSTYRIIPDADAPLMAPASQGKIVEVGRIGLTYVRLDFDTGIR